MLLLLLMGFAGLWQWRQTTAVPAMPPSKSQAPQPGKLPISAEPTSPDAPQKEVLPVAVNAPHIQMVGNLAELTKLQGELDILNLQVQVEEKRAKKRELESQGSVAPVKLPDLPLPPVADLPVMKAASAPRSASVVVSVQGVNSDLSATIRTDSGLMTVRKGSSFGGGVVAEISRHAVIIRRGSKTAALPFE